MPLRSWAAQMSAPSGSIPACRVRRCTQLICSAGCYRVNATSPRLRYQPQHSLLSIGLALATDAVGADLLQVKARQAHSPGIVQCIRHRDISVQRLPRLDVAGLQTGR